MHDGRVRRNGPSEHIVGVREVDDDDLVLLVDLFAHANVVVGLERQGLRRRLARVTQSTQRAVQRVALAWNDIEAGWMPTLESWRCSVKVMGFEASILPLSGVVFLG